MGRNSHDAVVIGGGLGGLAAAIRLAAKGRRVVLLEQSAALGGKAGSKVIQGYRFDTGPSLVTLPEVFNELFASAGRKREDYIAFRSLSPLTGYWFADGTRLCSDRIEVFVRTLENKLGVPPQDSQAFFSYAQKLYTIAGEVFLKSSLHDWRTYFSPQVLSSLMRIWKIDPFRSMYSSISRYFNDPRAVQLFCRYATYNGSDPYQAPGTMNNIAYVEHGLGGFAVEGGIYGIVEGMHRLANELGVEIRLNTRAQEVVTQGSRVTGVRTAEEMLPAPVVVSDVDVLTLYEQLLNDRSARPAKRYRRLDPSTSGIVFYWGMDQSFPQMGVHSIFFSADYYREFQQIHRFRQLPQDPTVYVNITSKITPEDAPAGGENWFVLVNSPPHDGRDWSQELPQLRRKVVSRISAGLGRDISGSIVCEGTLTPDEIESQTGSFQGSLYGISSNTRDSAFLRHSNRSRRWRGLYLCGGSVHPGGGMPLALLSAKLACDLISRYEPYP